MNKDNKRAPESFNLENVSISLGDKELLNISAEIRPGESLTVMGPSGSGKSTLLAYIAGFLDPAFSATGRVCFGKQNLTELPAEDRHVGLLFQDALLFPHMSVGQNLLFALPRSVSTNKAERRNIAENALAEAELAGMFDRDPATLSGGQKSRIALMRVLLARPKALLLDEPFSKLDAELRSQIRQFVFTEAKHRQLPVLMVTHDLADAKAAGGALIRLEG